MKKISSKLLAKNQHVAVFGFLSLVLILSVVWGVIFADDAVPVTPTIPLAPTNLSIHGNVTSIYVPLTWSDNSDNEDKFNVERKLSLETTWTSLTQITIPNTTVYTDTTVTAGATYDYRVQACLSGTGCSEYATLSNIAIPTPISTAGTTCANLTLSLNGGKTTYIVGDTVNYTWACTPGVASNVSVWLQKPNGTSTLYNSGSGSSTQTMGFSTSNLLPGAYILKTCFDTTCTTANASQTFTLATNTSLTPTIPLAPTNLSLNSNATSSYVSLRWNDNSNNEDKFNIERKLTSATTWTSLAQITTSNTTTYVDTTVTAGATYDYRVQACLLGTGCSEYFNLYSVVIPASSTIPTAPTNLTATVSGSNVVLNWSDNSSNEAGFKIYRGPTWTDIGNVGANVTTFTDSNRGVGTYTYHLNAFNSSNVYSPISNNVSVTITSTTDSGTTTTNTNTPNTSGGGVTITSCTSLNLTLNSTKTTYLVGDSVNYTWTCDTGVAANVFIFLQKPDGTSSLYNNSSGSITQTLGFSTSNLVPGAYTLKACFSTACSVANASKTFTIVANTSTTTQKSTIPTAPTNLTATVSGSNVVLSWSDNSSNEAGFKIYRGPTWTDIGNIGANVTTFTDSNRGVGTYTYHLNAFNSSNVYSPLSNDVSVTVGSTITPTTTPNTTVTSCGVLNLSLNDGKTSYTVGENINYTWKCNSNTPANNISVRLYKSDGTSTLYNSSSGSSTQTMGFSTSNLVPGVYNLKACFDAACTIIGATQSFTIVSAVKTSTTTTPVSTEVNATTIKQTTSITPSTTTPIVTTPTSTETSTTTIKPSTVANTTVPVATPTTTAPVISSVVFPVISPATTAPTTPTPSATTTEFSSKIENLGLAVEQQQVAVNDSKGQLVKIINDSVNDIVANTTTDQNVDTTKINTLRDELLKNVDSSLSTTVTTADINNLKTDINKGIQEINKTATGSLAVAPNTESMSSITNTLNTLSTTVNNQSETFKNQGGELLYKDSNKDGISDYDSVYVYKMDPIKPSPVSSYEGKTINASEKILLGFDPTRSEVVKINKEEPTASLASVVSTYKVKQIELTEKKEIIIKGQALPNSFITVYIYSTPVMVTVKTNSKGEWQYVLDKELENGNHTIYTATVNNSGNIVAKSAGYLFTKTAEAVTIKDLPAAGVSAENKPGFFTGNNLYAILAIISLVILLIIILVAVPTKKLED